MAIKYIAGSEDVPKLINLPFDQEDSWWGGVVYCTASVALGVSLALTALSVQVAQAVATSQQDDPAGHLLNFHVDEDYWQNPVAPVPANQYIQLPLGDPEEIPANKLFIGPLQEDVPNLQQPWDFNWTLLFFLDDGTAMPGFSPEEDLWQQVALVPPVPATNYQNLPYQFDQAEFMFVAANPEETFWVNPVPPVTQTFGPLYLPDPEELPAATFDINLDEDFWQNPVAPVVASLAYPQPFGFDNPELVRAPVPDDTANWLGLFPAPVPAHMFRALPLPFGGLTDLEGDAVPQPIIVVAGAGDIEIGLNQLECILRNLNHL